MDKAVRRRYAGDLGLYIDAIRSKPTKAWDKITSVAPPLRGKLASTALATISSCPDLENGV